MWQSNSIQQYSSVEPATLRAAAPPPRRSSSLRFSCHNNSFRLLSCSSNSNRDSVVHPQISKTESFDDMLTSDLDQAISLISNSDSLPKCETAVRVIAKAWLDSHEILDMKITLSTSAFIEGLLEISSTSKDSDVLELAISVLAELVAKSEVNRQVVLSVDSQLEILLRLAKNNSLFLKAVVLVYLLKPKAKQMLSSDWIPLVLRILDHEDETQTLFTVQCCPKTAAIYLLDQLIMGFDVDRNLENAKQVVALGGLGHLIKILEIGTVREKESCATLIAACVRADGSCRDYLIANIKKASIVHLFSGNQLKSNGGAISLLSELVCLNRCGLTHKFLQRSTLSLC